jgi:hypothetical protein
MGAALKGVMGKRKTESEVSFPPDPISYYNSKSAPLLSYLRNVLGTPLPTIMWKTYRISKYRLWRELNDLYLGKEISEAIGFATMLFSVYDFILLTISREGSKYYAQIIGFGGEHARRTSIPVTPPIDVVEVFFDDSQGIKILAFRDSRNRMFYYVYDGNRSPSYWLLPSLDQYVHVRKAHYENLSKLRNLIADLGAKEPFVYNPLYPGEIYEVTIKDSEFSYFSAKKHKYYESDKLPDLIHLPVLFYEDKAQYVYYVRLIRGGYSKPQLVYFHHYRKQFRLG